MQNHCVQNAGFAIFCKTGGGWVLNNTKEEINKYAIKMKIFAVKTQSPWIGSSVYMCSQRDSIVDYQISFQHVEILF